MLKITRHQGFHLTFKNGWTASVQWGPGTYTDHHNTDLYTGPKDNERWESSTAEVACWGVDGKMANLGDDTVKGYLSADEVLTFLNEVAAR